jgi:hypothetical protein
MEPTVQLAASLALSTFGKSLLDAYYEAGLAIIKK